MPTNQYMTLGSLNSDVVRGWHGIGVLFLQGMSGPLGSFPSEPKNTRGNTEAVRQKPLQYPGCLSDDRLMWASLKIYLTSNPSLRAKTLEWNGPTGGQSDESWLRPGKSLRVHFASAIASDHAIEPELRGICRCNEGRDLGWHGSRKGASAMRFGLNGSVK